MAKCVDCGFLSTRDYESRELAEVDSDFRRSGAPTPMPGSPRHSQERAPICFVQSFDLQAELLGPLTPEYPPGSQTRAQMLDAIPARVILELFDRERPECDANEKFSRWQQGFTPKEHREMLERQWLQEREDRRDREMREREDRRDREADKRHWREMVVMGGVVTLALTIATVVAAIIEGAVSRGWAPMWWPF